MSRGPLKSFQIGYEGSSFNVICGDREGVEEGTSEIICAKVFVLNQGRGLQLTGVADWQPRKRKEGQAS